MSAHFYDIEFTSYWFITTYAYKYINKQSKTFIFSKTFHKMSLGRYSIAHLSQINGFFLFNLSKIFIKNT